jgi:hypothetical protein
MGQWPAQLYVAVERTTATYAWDDFTSTWDDPALLWDAPGASDYIDAVCTMHGLSIDVGAPDGTGQFTAGEAAMTLDNRDGAWSSYDPQGRLTDWQIGRRLLVWAELEGEPWWLFAGTITAWRELPTGMVEVEAADAFSRLAEGIGRWDPGTFGQHPGDRLEAICDLIGYDEPRRFDLGDVTLHGVSTDRTPLEEMQQVALSDGGVLGVDADGTLLYRDRTWGSGRDDQVTVPVLSANVCAVDAVLWDLELVTDDRALVNRAVLSNVAEPELTVQADNFDSQLRYGVHTVPGSRAEDQWTTTGEGQALAEFLVRRDGDAVLRIGSALLYLHDPRQDLWRLGVDRRLGDLVRLLHDQPAAGGGTWRLDLLLVLETIRHDITPDTWTVELATTRAVSSRVTERWDESAYRWDDTDPANTWGY